MDHFKRPIEIEVLGLKTSNKPTNSTLCGWQVCYVLGFFFMGWGNKIWVKLGPVELWKWISFLENFYQPDIPIIFQQQFPAEISASVNSALSLFYF